MILNPHYREQALMRITALQIIVNAEVSDIESFSKATDLLSDLAFYVGGVKGTTKIVETLERRANDIKGDNK